MADDPENANIKIREEFSRKLNDTLASFGSEGCKLSQFVEEFRKDWGWPVDEYQKHFGCETKLELLRMFPTVVSVVGDKLIPIRNETNSETHDLVDATREFQSLRKLNTGKANRLETRVKNVTSISAFRNKVHASMMDLNSEKNDTRINYFPPPNVQKIPPLATACSQQNLSQKNQTMNFWSSSSELSQKVRSSSMAPPVTKNESKSNAMNLIHPPGIPNKAMNGAAPNFDSNYTYRVLMEKKKEMDALKKDPRQPMYYCSPPIKYSPPVVGKRPLHPDPHLAAKAQISSVRPQTQQSQQQQDPIHKVQSWLENTTEAYSDISSEKSLFDDPQHQQMIVRLSPSSFFKLCENYNNNNDGDQSIHGPQVPSQFSIKYSPQSFMRLFADDKNNSEKDQPSSSSSSLYEFVNAIVKRDEQKQQRQNRNVYNEIELGCQPKDWTDAAAQRLDDSLPLEVEYATHILNKIDIDQPSKNVQKSPQKVASKQTNRTDEQREEGEVFSDDEACDDEEEDDDIPVRIEFTGLETLDMGSPEFMYQTSINMGYFTYPAFVHRMVAILQSSKCPLDIDQIKGKYKQLYNTILSTKELNYILSTNANMKIARDAFLKCPILGLFKCDSSSLKTTFSLANNACINTADLETLIQLKMKSPTVYAAGDFSTVTGYTKATNKTAAKITPKALSTTSNTKSISSNLQKIQKQSDTCQKTAVFESKKQQQNDDASKWTTNNWHSVQPEQEKQKTLISNRQPHLSRLSSAVETTTHPLEKIAEEGVEEEAVAPVTKNSPPRPMKNENVEDQQKKARPLTPLIDEKIEEQLTRLGSERIEIKSPIHVFEQNRVDRQQEVNDDDNLRQSESSASPCSEDVFMQPSASSCIDTQLNALVDAAYQIIRSNRRVMMTILIEKLAESKDKALFGQFLKDEQFFRDLLLQHQNLFKFIHIEALNEVDVCDASLFVKESFLLKQENQQIPPQKMPSPKSPSKNISIKKSPAPKHMLKPFDKGIKLTCILNHAELKNTSDSYDFSLKFVVKDETKWAQLNRHLGHYEEILRSEKSKKPKNFYGEDFANNPQQDVAYFLQLNGNSPLQRVFVEEECDEWESDFIVRHMDTDVCFRLGEKRGASLYRIPPEFPWEDLPPMFFEARFGSIGRLRCETKVRQIEYDLRQLVSKKCELNVELLDVMKHRPYQASLFSYMVRFADAQGNQYP